MTHTPGPWRVFGGLTDGYGVVSTASKDEIYGTNAARPSQIFSGSQRANADLIAAAPDLLAALQGLVELYDLDELPISEIKPRLATARAVIAKAQGEVAP